MLAPNTIATMQENAHDAAALLRALSNETRLLVMCHLGQGELSVGEINEAVRLSQSALSQHLAKLREEGFVSTRRDGQTIYYRLSDPRVSRLIGALHDIFCNPKKGRKS
jgi:ArsR family transcriptional regulator, virulence genes transcriptional regulator